MTYSHNYIQYTFLGGITLYNVNISNNDMFEFFNIKDSLYQVN